MKILLTKRETDLLFMRDIPFLPSQDYTEDEALDLLNALRESEVFYAQGTDSKSISFYKQFQQLADKIFDLIPED